MTRIYFVLALFLLPGFLPAQELEKLLLNSENDKALHQIDSLLQLNNNQPDLHLKKGIILQRKFDYTGALFNLKKAWLLDSLNKTTISELAEVNSSLGNYRQALPFYQALYKADTTSIVNALRLARSCFNLKSYDEAYRILLSACKYDSTNLYLNKQLAFSALRTGHDSLAIALYCKIIRQNPSDLNNFNNLVTLYQRNEKQDLVIETLEEALLRFPEERNLLVRSADAHFARHAYPKAIQNYENYLASGDSVPEVIKNLGISYFYERRALEGIYLIEKYLTFKPNDPVAGLYAGLCYKELKQNDQAIAYLNFAQKIAIPGYMADIYNQMGLVYGTKKAYKKSVEYLKKAYLQDPSRSELLFKIAHTYDEWQKDKSPAIRYYNYFLKASKENTDYLRQLGKYAAERTERLKR